MRGLDSGLHQSASGQSPGLNTNSGCGHHATSNSLFRAIRKQRIGTARSTQRRCADAFRRHSRGEQLATVRFHQIEENFLGQLTVTGSSSRQKQQRILFADRIRFLDFTKQLAAILELGFELGTNLGTNAVATTMNTGADGRLEIPRASTEAALHFAHAFFHDTFHRPPPARMEDSHRTALCVYKYDRQAVRGQNCEQETWGLCDQTVARKTHLRGFRNAMNEIRVNLAECNQRPFTPLSDRSYLAQKCSPVLFYRPLCILASETQIQAPLAISPGKSARPGAEAMNQPPQVDKGIGVENLALSFPEGFQRHRNILATYLLSVIPTRPRYVENEIALPLADGTPRIILRCADSRI
jgi:hypothetical protein